MKRKLIHFSSLFLLMLITGVFWGTWFTLTRSIENFSLEEFIHIGKVIIDNVAIPMRIIMPSGILLMFLSLRLHEDKRSIAYYSGVASFVLIFIALLITLLVLVPIDNEIKQWIPDSAPADWESIRNKWKIFHALRTFASLLSFGLFTVFVIKAKQPE
jgi:uncharacterized membrane protein